MFGLSVSLFVSLFVHHFLPCLRVHGTFKSSLYGKQVDQVKKVACSWSMIDRYSLEAKKNACFDTRLNVAFQCDDFSVRKFHLTQL